MYQHRGTKNRVKAFLRKLLSTLTHFWPIFIFYVHWKHEKSFTFLAFSGRVNKNISQIWVNEFWQSRAWQSLIYDIFWRLFYHSSSFLNGKGLLIHLNRNLSSKWVPQDSRFGPTLPLLYITDFFNDVLLKIQVSTQNVPKYLTCKNKLTLSRNCILKTQ